MWTPSHGWAKAGWPARTYIQQLCAHTGCSLEDLLEVMDDRKGWQERVREIHAGGVTWWWWNYTTNPPSEIVTIINCCNIDVYIYIYIYDLICGLFNAKPIPAEEYLPQSLVDKAVHAFPKSISPKGNMIAKLEFELAYTKTIALYFSHYSSYTDIYV